MSIINHILANKQKYIAACLIPIIGLAVLEVIWNSLGTLGYILSLPLWGIKLAILAYAGFRCTQIPTRGPRAIFWRRAGGGDEERRASTGRGRI